MSELEWCVKRCEAKHWDDMRAIWENRINPPRTHMNEYLHAAMESDTENVTGMIAEQEDGSAIGFSVLTTAKTGKKNIDTYLDDFNIDVSFSGKQGIIEAIAVKSGLDGNGVASSVLSKGLDVLSDQNVTTAYAVSWNRDNHVDSRVLFNKFDFEQVGEISNYYERLPCETQCIDCVEQCTCNATVHKKELNSTATK